MAYAADQVEKPTIVLRLAVSIYQMKETQLRKLLQALEHHPDKGGQLADRDPRNQPTGENPAIRRQMLIARIFVSIKQMDKDTLLRRLRAFNHPNVRWVREYPRLPCLLLVDFAANGKAHRSCIRDISATGVFIETSEVFAVGQQVALCFTLTEAGGSLPFKIKGRVIRLYPEGIGVQYENVTHYQREILQTLISRNE